MTTIQHIRSIISQHQPKSITNSQYKKAAVLVPLVEQETGLHLLFTKRTDSVEHHKGQISFPGGAVDDGDASLIETALRESFEEIGLEKSAVEIFGMLDDLQTPSEFVVTPIVGYIKHLPRLMKNDNEVAEIFLLPFEEFFDVSKCRSEIRTLNGMTRQVYFFDVGSEVVWGATAFFVKQLVDVIDGEQN